jgi:hypothetical protein
MAHSDKAISTWSAAEVAAEVATRLKWTDRLKDEFEACGIDGEALTALEIEDLLQIIGGLPPVPSRLAIDVLADMKAIQPIEYHDHFLGRNMRRRFVQRAQIDAPLHIIEAAAARLHLPSGHPPDGKPPLLPSGYTRVSLSKAQLQRAAIGFEVVASHKLATPRPPASVDVSAKTVWRWRTRILLRVMCGHVAKIQARARVRTVNAGEALDARAKRALSGPCVC